VGVLHQREVPFNRNDFEQTELECLEQKHWMIKPAIRWYSKDPFSSDFTEKFVRQSQPSKYEQEIEDWQDLLQR
jgi:hypothetical protein